MARRAEAVAGRFRRLKLKLGGRDGLDVERVRAVRAVTDVPLQVDVNEYWSLEEAREALPQLAELGVEYCEQPLPAGTPAAPSYARPRRSRSTSTRTATRSPTWRRAPSARTGSTSSSRSPAACGRPCAWRRPPGRSGSASCSAAWSSQASGSRRQRTSRRSATTSTSTATSCCATTRGRACVRGRPPAALRTARSGRVPEGPWSTPE